MIRKVLASLKRLDLDGDVRHIVLGVSGGADSVALLASLAELRSAIGYELTVAHVNHKTRGAESDADASFVRRLCKKLGVKCAVKVADVPALAQRRRISLEMAARETRYDFFLQQARKTSGVAIVTAHTKDDQAETIVLKLARGAGMKGLAGIPECGQVADVPVLRPMLDITRKEIVAFLRRRGVEWREDASNKDQRHLRNRVRSQVLPLLRSTLNPEICDALARTANVLREDDDLLEELATAALAECRLSRRKLDLKELKQEHRSVTRRVLMMWLIDCGVDQSSLDLELISEIEKLINGRKANASTAVTGGFTVLREYDALSVMRRRAVAPAAFKCTLAVPGEAVLDAVGLRAEAAVSQAVVRERGRPGRYPVRATISRQAVGRKKLTVRSPRDGDRIKPMGMRGSRKLKDVFIDLKIPAAKRRSLPVVECGGEIVWVPGYRVARGWEVKEGEGSVRLSLVRA